MELKDKAGWNKAVKANSDGYEKGVIDYAERWANLMEKNIRAGKKLADIAKQTSHDADIDGITGFMYGAAVSTLAQVWKYGEELRRWSNLDLQIHDEGERANESGGVLNPALMTIQTK